MNPSGPIVRHLERACSALNRVRNAALGFVWRHGILSPPGLDVERATRFLTEFDSTPAELIDPEDWGGRIHRAFAGHRITTPVYKPGARLYRGVLVEHAPANVSRVTYAPAARVTQWGRLNCPGESIFYCSATSDAVFFELEPAPGALVAIGHWETHNELRAAHAGYSESVSTALGSRRPLPVYVSGDDRTPAIRAGNDLIAERFARRYDHPDDYRRTVALRNYFWKGPFDGFVYPAIAMRGNADNFALRPRYVDRCMSVVCVDLFQVKTVDMAARRIGLDLLDHATSFAPDGTIEWSGPPPRSAGG